MSVGTAKCALGCGGNSRSTVDWKSPDYLDNVQLATDLRRVFDICSECRICESLCDSFPRLFDLIDQSPTKEIGAVPSESLKSVVDACTLCDMCYPVCPYKPPHDYAVDFPNLMVRYRALENRQGKIGFFERELGKIDRNGRLATLAAPVVNWVTSRENRVTRSLMEKVAGVHRDAWLPCYQSKTLGSRAKAEPALRIGEGGRKVVIYNNCLVEYNTPDIGLAARSVLSRNGVKAEFVYPGCCGMPAMEHGDLEAACTQAEIVSRELVKWMDDGYDVVSLIPSCTFMVKGIWPLYMPENANVARLAQNTFDICEYIIALSRADSLAEGLKPLDGGVALHVACHSRAQDMGVKSAVMLRMIPDLDVLVIERCSGHGGTWGVMKENFDVGMKVGEALVKQAANSGRRYLASECPLAGEQIVQGMEAFPDSSKPGAKCYHPIEILEMSYRGGVCS